MIEVEMKDGFVVNVDESCQNDWGFLTKLRKVDKGDAGVMVDVAETLLGSEEAVDRLADHLAVNGKTTVEVMVDALSEIMEAVNELKN